MGDSLFCDRQWRQTHCCSGRWTDEVNRSGLAVEWWFVPDCPSQSRRRQSRFGACSCIASKTWRRWWCYDRDGSSSRRCCSEERHRILRGQINEESLVMDRGCKWSDLGQYGRTDETTSTSLLIYTFLLLPSLLFVFTHQDDVGKNHTTPSTPTACHRTHHSIPSAG